LFGGVVPLRGAENLPLTRGTAITDPDLLRKLDQDDLLTLSRLLWPERNANFPLTTDLMFSWLPQLAPIPAAIDAEFDRYVARHKAASPDETIGVGEGFDVQLFDRASLKSKDTRFVLAGIVNRMDRAYVSEESCGEIRLIYRLARFDAPADGKTATRLPMTLNLVMKANDARLTGPGGKPFTCAEIARRTCAIDGRANNSLLASGELSDSAAGMMRPRPNLPRSSSRSARGSVIAVPRSNAAAPCA